MEELVRLRLLIDLRRQKKGKTNKWRASSPLDVWQLLQAKKIPALRHSLSCFVFCAHIRQQRYNVLIRELYCRATLRVPPFCIFFFLLSRQQSPLLTAALYLACSHQGGADLLIWVAARNYCLT